MPITKIYPDHDSYVDKDNPDATNGGGWRLYLKYTNEIKKIAFLHFLTTLIPPGDTINSATLKMYQAVKKTGADLNPVYKNIASFDEATICWNNKPAKTGSILGYMPINVVNTWGSLDITTLFNEWHKGIIDNYGIQIEPEAIDFGADNPYWWSVETTGTSSDPYIEVDHSTGVITKTFEDSGVGIDNLLVDKTLIFPDSGIGIDKWVLPAITYVVFSDSGSGADTFKVDKTLVFSDAGSGIDIFKIDKTVVFSDIGEGVDVFLVDKEVIFKDVATAIDKFRAAYPYPKNLRRKIIIIRDIK